MEWVAIELVRHFARVQVPPFSLVFLLELIVVGVKSRQFREHKNSQNPLAVFSPMHFAHSAIMQRNDKNMFMFVLHV